MSKPIDQERALFEASIVKKWPSAPVHVVRDLLPPEDPEYGAYVDQDIRAAWVGWQARAAVQPAGVAVPEGWLVGPEGSKSMRISHCGVGMCFNEDESDRRIAWLVDFLRAIHAAAPHPVSGVDFNPEHTLFNEIRASMPVNENDEPTRYIITEAQLQRIRSMEFRPHPVSGGQKVDGEFVLPCDIKLPGGMTVGKGCTLSTLMLALRNRGDDTPWRQRFGVPQPFDPALLNIISAHRAQQEEQPS